MWLEVRLRHRSNVLSFRVLKRHITARSEESLDDSQVAEARCVMHRGVPVVVLDVDAASAGFDEEGKHVLVPPEACLHKRRAACMCT